MSESRMAATGDGMVALRADVSLGLKLLRSRRELWLILVVLTAGLGPALAVYSLIHAVLLTPLPLVRPQELVRVWTKHETTPDSRTLGFFELQLLASQATELRSIAGYRPIHAALLEGSGREVDVTGAMMAGDGLSVFGVRPLSGGTIEKREAASSGPLPVVISERLVTSGLVNGRIGGLITLDSTRYRVVGVMPASFWFPDRRTVYWLRLPTEGLSERQLALATPPMPAIARLAPQSTPATAEAEANALVNHTVVASSVDLTMTPYTDTVLGPVRPALVVLQIAAALLLLLVLLNAAWLYAARSRRLVPTMSILRACGASRARLIRVSVISAIGVGIAASVPAAAVAWGLLRVTLALESGTITRIADPSLTGRVLLTGVCAAVLAAALAAVPGILMATPHSERIASASGASQRRPAGSVGGMAVQVGLVFIIGVPGGALWAGPHGACPDERRLGAH